MIIDYGVGNLRSVENMLRKARVACTTSGDADVIRAAEKLILPGVGHFAHGMHRLHESGLVETLDWVAKEEKRPVLGICLGAQILGKGSEEAPGTEGLGWIDMTCHRFSSDDGLPVPHMGWNEIELKTQCPLFANVEADTRYYFVHSYHMVCKHESNVVATTTYGEEFISVVSAGNIFGTQFHPEKSHRFGLSLMSAFAGI